MEDEGKGDGWCCSMGLVGLLMVVFSFIFLFFFILLRLLGNGGGFVVGVPWVEAKRG